MGNMTFCNSVKGAKQHAQDPSNQSRYTMADWKLECRVGGGIPLDFDGKKIEIKYSCLDGSVHTLTSFIAKNTYAPYPDMFSVSVDIEPYDHNKIYPLEFWSEVDGVEQEVPGLFISTTYLNPNVTLDQF